MAVNPQERKREREEKGWGDDGPGTNFLSATGRFPVAVAGWERFNSSQKGTPGIMFRLVVVEGPQAGAVTDRNFWLTANALDQLADFALAFGYEDPFDENDEDDIERIVTFGSGVISATVKSENYTKNDGSAGTKYEAKFFGKHRGVVKDEWKEHVKAGEKSFSAYLQWREGNPRPQPGQSQPRRDVQHQAARNTGAGQAPPPYNDDDVPF